MGSRRRPGRSSEAPWGPSALHAGALALLALVAGCRSTLSQVPGVRWVASAAQPASGVTEDELRSELGTYVNGFEARVVTASDAISSASKVQGERRAALLWKLNMIPLVERAAYLPDVEVSYLALYTTAVSLNEYLSTGEGATLFGEQQPVATRASAELEQRIEAIGSRFLTSEQLARVKRDVAEVVRQHPIRGVFVPETVAGLADATAPGGRFDWLVHLPLTPFRALQGVDSGAQAIRDFNTTAQRFTQVAGSLPLLLRWNLELLAFDLERHESVESGLLAFQSVARSADSLSVTAQALPADLRAQASALLGQVEASQGELRQTLEEARDTLSGAERVAQSVAPVADAMERTATQAQQAGIAWRSLVEAVRGPAERPPGKAEEARAFDIREYEETAGRVQSAAVELRALVADLHQLAGSEELGQVTKGSRGLVDLAAWRGLELLLAFFALLFGYRRLEGWLARRRAARQPSGATR